MAKSPQITEERQAALLCEDGGEKMGKKKHQGHYCKICCLQKPNERFSGKGHAANICKDCARLSLADQSKLLTMNRLMNLSFRRLTDNELTWLKNCTKDSREEVSSLAKEIYAQCFSHAERNQMKKQLYIKELTFTLSAFARDVYDDEIPVNCQFYLKRSEPSLLMKILDDSSESVSMHLEHKKYAKLLKSMIYYYEIFCWDQDYCSDMSIKDIDPEFEFDYIPKSEDSQTEETSMDETEPTWRVSIKYTNGTEQDIHGTDVYLPDKVGKLYLDLIELLTPIEEPDLEQVDFDNYFIENDDYK